MELTKISIVTPSFNQGKFIEEAILSVLNQGYNNFEHIIVDNCSFDDTLEIIKRYPHVRLISEPDEGQSDALNKGFKLATGDIIGWLNADDFYHPGVFYTIHQTFLQHKVDAVYADVSFVNEHGDHVRYLKSHRPLKWLSLFYTFIQSTSFFFRREIIDNNHLLDKALHYKMDKDFFAKLLYSGYRFKYLNECFASFRWHDSNKSNRTDESRWKSTLEGYLIFTRYARLNWQANKRNIRLYLYGIRYLAQPVRTILKFLPS